MFTAKTLAPGDALDDAFSVRTEVFIHEQGFDPVLEMDAIDATAHHVVLYDGSASIATGRVFPVEGDPTTYIIGRVAVLKPYRGGTGRELMGHLETLCKRLGATTVTLGAQCTASEFYTRLGYTPYGEQYMDEHCPHVHMKKAL